MKKLEVNFSSPEILKDVALDSLAAYRGALESAAKEIKAQLNLVEMEIGVRYLVHEQGARERANKSHGVVLVDKYLGVGQVVKVVSNITKKVDYTQTKLRELFGSLSIDEAQKYITVDFHVSETNYPKLQAYLKEYEQLAYGAGSNVLSDILEESRIVKYSAPKISLELENA